MKKVEHGDFLTNGETSPLTMAIVDSVKIVDGKEMFVPMMTFIDNDDESEEELESEYIELGDWRYATEPEIEELIKHLNNLGYDWDADKLNIISLEYSEPDCYEEPRACIDEVTEDGIHLGFRANGRGVSDFKLEDIDIDEIRAAIEKYDRISPDKTAVAKKCVDCMLGYLYANRIAFSHALRESIINELNSLAAAD